VHDVALKHPGLVDLWLDKGLTFSEFIANIEARAENRGIEMGRKLEREQLAAMYDCQGRTVP